MSTNKPTVSELRTLIKDATKPSSVANGKPVFRLPCGQLVSKAKLEQLTIEWNRLNKPKNTISTTIWKLQTEKLLRRNAKLESMKAEHSLQETD